MASCDGWGYSWPVSESAKPEDPETPAGASAPVWVLR